MSATTTEITTTTTTSRQIAKKPIDTFRDLLDRLRPQIQMALPKHIDLNRMIRICLTTIQRNPQLLDCTQDSLLGCLFQCVQLGLEPDGLLGHAYLIPFRDNKNNRTICTLIVGYKGLLKLARQSNEIMSISARVVYSKDEFEYAFGLEDKLNHIPTHDEDPGEMTFAYAIFRYKGGGYHFDVMSKKEIDGIRGRSKTGNNGPWVTDYDEMAKKTVLRRASKMAPASIEDLARAVAIDSQAEAGLAPALDIEIPAAEVPGAALEEQGKRIALKSKPGGGTIAPAATTAVAKAAAQAAPAKAATPTAKIDPGAVISPGPGKVAETAASNAHDSATGETQAGATAEMLKEIDELVFATRITGDAVLEWFPGVKQLGDLTASQAVEAIETLRGIDNKGSTT